MDARVTLHLAGHCVETAARKEFKRLMDAAFDEPGDSPEQEARIELVRAFLASADFPALRASDPRLGGEVDAAVVLSRGPLGEIKMEIREPSEG
jgi:hypothetical protein